MKKYKAIIFDFDGVLIDSEVSFFKIVKSLCKEQGIDVPLDFMRQTAGLTAPELVQTIADAHPLKNADMLIERARKEYRGKLESLVEPIKSTTTFVRNYKGKSVLSIASMSSRSIIERILTNFYLLDKFLHISTQEDVHYFKPHPEVYLLALDKLKLPPDDCIVIEDSLHGIQAARAAGLEVYAVPHGFFSKDQLLKTGASGFIEKTEDVYHLAL